MTADDSPLRVLAWPAFDNTTGNPYNRLLYEAMESQGPQVDEFTPRRALLGLYDIWHMHWPDDLLSMRDKRAALLRVVGLILLMAWMRLRGTRIVWTVHDLGPHESYHPVLERWFWRFFLPQIDGFISLSQHGKRMAERVFPPLQDVPGFVVPHGHYRAAYANTIAKDDAREALDLDPDAPVLLYVGRIRRYKNVPHLVRIFRMLEDAAALRGRQSRVADAPARHPDGGRRRHAHPAHAGVRAGRCHAGIPKSDGPCRAPLRRHPALRQRALGALVQPPRARAEPRRHDRASGAGRAGLGADV